MSVPPIGIQRKGVIGATRSGACETVGRAITPEELAQWCETGAWPESVSASADYVELTADEVRAMGETGAWPVRLG